MAKKSRVLAVLLLVAVLVSACSVSEQIKQPVSVNGDPSATTGQQQNAETSPAPQQTEAVEVAITETVLYEAEGVKVTATGYEDGWMGPEVKLLVENSSAKNVLVTAKDVSVNGYMMPGASLYAEVAAGKKANENLSFSSSELKQSGIETVAVIELYIKISDGDNWEDLAISDLITLNTTAAGLEQPVDDSGDVLYDEKDIKVVCKGLKQDVIWDGTVVFYMENNSKQPVSVHAENVSVNGFMQEVGFWSDLRRDTRIVDGMTLLNLEDLELESLDDVKQIEFNLRIVHAETWDELATTDTITLNFE